MRRKKVSDSHIFPSYSYSVSVYVALGCVIVEAICSASHFSCYLQVHAVDLLLRLRQILNKHKKKKRHEKTATSNNRQCGVFRWTQMKYFETSVLMSAKEVKMQSKQTHTRSLILTIVARGDRLCPFRTNMLNNSVVAEIGSSDFTVYFTKVTQKLLYEASGGRRGSLRG